METAKPTILVTGVSGNLGRRLLKQLSAYTVVGVDLTPPTDSDPVDRFVPLDLGREESTRQLYLLIKELQPVSVVHLAFVVDPQRTGVLDIGPMRGPGMPMQPRGPRPPNTKPPGDDDRD